MCARGCHTPEVQTVEWAHSHGDTFAALGHILGDDGRIAPCLSKTLSNMWKSFYGNFGKSMLKAPLKTKLDQLQRCVLPIAAYRMSRWLYQAYAAKRVDRTQTKMVRILMGTKMSSRRIQQRLLKGATACPSPRPESMVAGAISGAIWRRAGMSI